MRLKTLRDYQNMMEKNLVIHIDRDFDLKALKSFRKQTHEVVRSNPKTKTLALVINSWGGDISIAYQIINEVEALRSKYDVWVIGGAIVASAGAITLLSFPSDRRVAFPESLVYNHKPHSSTTARANSNVPELIYTNLEDQALIKDVKRTEKALIRQIAEQTHLNLKQAKALVRKKPKYLTTQQALRYGFYSIILS